MRTGIGFVPQSLEHSYSFVASADPACRLSWSLLPRIIALLAVSLSLQATEIRIQHSVIRKLLADQVFTDDGRKYIRATRADRCSYAYLENPQIDADKGQLRIKARFTGRSGWNGFGRCISLGDSFTAVIYATPFYDNGNLKLKDVRVESADNDGFYIRRVRLAMSLALPQQFSYRLYDDAKRILEQQQPGETFHKAMVSFNVTQIRVTDQQIVLGIDYVVDVK